MYKIQIVVRCKYLPINTIMLLNMIHSKVEKILEQFVFKHHFVRNHMTLISSMFQAIAPHLKEDKDYLSWKSYLKYISTEIMRDLNMVTDDSKDKRIHEHAVDPRSKFLLRSFK